MLTGASVPDLPIALWSLWAVRVALIGLLLLVCVTDVRERRIPNRLVLAGLGVALGWHLLGAPGDGLFAAQGAGALGMARALGGALAGFAAFMLLYLARVMGAGDVKLMGLLGAMFGLAALPWLLLCIFATGGLVAGVRMLDPGRRRRVLGNVRLILFGAASTLTSGGGPRFDPAADTADRLPFALAMVGGALVLAALQWTGRFT